MLVNIKASKTDQVRKGFTISLATSGSTNCAVRAVLDYLHRRGNLPGPPFIHQGGRDLTRPTLSKWLQATAIRAGLAVNGSGHSLPIGAATTAAHN